MRLVPMTFGLVAGCALMRSTPEEVPPPAVTARDFWRMNPDEQDRVLPRPRRFAASDWLNRLICTSDESHPSWRRTEVKGTLERYMVDCQASGVHVIRLDLAEAPPPPPDGLRLLGEEGFEHYKTSLEKGERKEWAGALSEIDKALEASPDEPVYQVARLSMLFASSRSKDSLEYADSLLGSSPPPIVWKYRALASRDLGRPDELLASLNGLIAATMRGDGLYAEGVCARGLLLAGTSRESLQSTLDIEEGCELRQSDCCQKLEEDRAAARAAERALEAAGKLKLR